MRIAGLAFCLCFGFIAPAVAFDRGAERAVVLQGADALTRQGVPAARRTLAAFAVEDRLVTMSAYGRRARARMNGDIDALREARAMGKVFDGAPQPALVTFELSVRF